MTRCPWLAAMARAVCLMVGYEAAAIIEPGLSPWDYETRAAKAAPRIAADVTDRLRVEWLERRG